MKKVILICFFMVVSSINLIAYMIYTYASQELVGDIVKISPEYIYFVDSRKPRLLIKIDKHFIKSIYSGSNDVTLDILLSEEQTTLDYDLYKSVIDLNEDFPEVEFHKKDKLNQPNPTSKPMLSLKGSFELGNLSFSSTSDTDNINSKFGYSISGEGYRSIYSKTYLGLGVIYQFKRPIKGNIYQINDGFRYVAVYPLLRYDLSHFNKTDYVYTFLNLGYSKIFSTRYKETSDSIGGLYYGLGLGWQTSSIILEIAYKSFGSSNNYYEDYENKDVSIFYRIVSLSLGFVTF